MATNVANLMAASADFKNDDVPIPTIKNIVSIVNLGCRLDLEAIASSRVGKELKAEYKPNCELDELVHLIGNIEARFFRHAAEYTEYNRTQRFTFVTMSMQKPKTTALIFSYGKMVCTGATTELESNLAARKYVRIIQKLGFPAKFRNFEIENVVGICDLNFPIRVQGLASSYGDLSRFKPDEVRDVAVYIMKSKSKNTCTFIVNPSGKIVLTGAKGRDEIYTAFQKIYPMVTECREVSAMDCCDQLSNMSLVECRKPDNAEDFCDQLSGLSINGRVNGLS